MLVAVVAPLLFLKGAPDGAPRPTRPLRQPPRRPSCRRGPPACSPPPTPAPPAAATGTAQDPFSPPAAFRAAAASAAAAGTATTAKSSGDAARSTSSGTTSTKPIPVVIQNGSSSKKSPKSSKSSGNSNSSTAPASTQTVDIRFGKKKDSPIKRAIPRNKAFYIHGKLVAMFVKYSPNRKKAIFAVAPGVHISGPVSTRVSDNVRYVDVPVGSHARLTMITANRVIVKRRLDIVRARSVSRAKATPAAASAEGACLLGKLVAMKPGDRFLDRDACEL